MLKIELDDVRLEQRFTVWRQGSLLKGDIETGVRGLEVRVEIASREPRDRLAELVRLAKASCFTHGALAHVVPVEATVSVNGEAIA
jgi:hypothetical protein